MWSLEDTWQKYVFTFTKLLVTKLEGWGSERKGLDRHRLLVLINFWCYKSKRCFHIWKPFCWGYFEGRRKPQIYEAGQISCPNTMEGQQNINKRITNDVIVHNTPHTRFSIISFEDQFDKSLPKEMKDYANTHSDLPSRKGCPWYHII